MQIKILGREPALWLALIGALVTWLVGMNVDFLSAGQGVALVTSVTAAVIAATTRPIGPPLFVAAVSALGALFSEYGLHWSDAAVTGLGGIILTGFALFGIRPQVTPNSDPTPIAPAQGSVR